MSPVPMRDRVAIGQRWRRRRDKQLARIRQIHRADRLAELELELVESPAPTRTVLFVDFGELRSRWQPLDEPPTPTNADAGSRR